MTWLALGWGGGGGEISSIVWKFPLNEMFMGGLLVYNIYYRVIRIQSPTTLKKQIFSILFYNVVLAMTDENLLQVILQ